MADRDATLAGVQRGLFRDHKILLVERGARFDPALAQAVDDVVRRVFRRPFEITPVLPTLRTIAVEHTALLSEALAAAAGDNTGAQMLPQSQSLVIYDEGRKAKTPLGLLGLLVHEMGHAYHMSLDFDAGDLVAENGRVEFPVPAFVALVRPFGWTAAGYYDGGVGGDLPLIPRFVYAGMSQPVFRSGKGLPEEWQAWLDGVYEDLGESPTYLHTADFARQGIVGDGTR